MDQFKYSKRPLISVITAVYNAEATLQKTIDNVVCQMHSGVEYIIVDGGSTDNTISIIKKNSANITKWISEPDNGIYDAFNKGIRMANGILIGIINADDWYEPDTFSLIDQHYTIDPTVDVYYGLARFWDVERHLMAVQGYTDLFLSQGMISHPTCFLKKTIYEKVAMFDTKYKIAADYDLMLNLKKAGCRFHFIEEVLANFRDGGISTTKIYELKNELLKIKKAHDLITERQYRVGKLQLRVKKILNLF